MIALTLNPDITHYTLSTVISIRIKHILLEAPRGCVLQEHNVKFRIGSSLCLWQAEETIHNTRQREAEEYEGELAAHISLIGVDGIGNSDTTCDVNGLAHAHGDGNRFPAKSSGGDFGKDNEAEGADRKVVEEIIDQSCCSAPKPRSMIVGQHREDRP